jgi:transcriptional regulator with XRE-family HTH domain
VLLGLDLREPRPRRHDGQSDTTVTRFFTSIASNVYDRCDNCESGNLEMDTNWFREALRRAGSSQADLARHLDLPPSAVSRMVKGDRQMKLQEAVQIATFLDISAEELLRRAGSDAGPSSAEPARPGRPPGRERPLLQPPPSRDQIPIRDGAGRTSSNEEPIGYTPRPANLAGVRDAYALYMLGESLAPRYEPGWLLHIHPFKPPMRGRDVVVWKKDQTMMITQFVGWDGDVLLLRQLNPAESLRVPRDDIAACHLVVGVDQEG